MWFSSFLFWSGRLLADAEFLLRDDGAIAVDVLADQIVEKTTTLTYEGLEGACCCVILVVVLQVGSEVLDTLGEEGDLAFRAAGVSLALSVGLENVLLFFS